MSQSPIDIAKGPILGYNNKDWGGVKASVVPGFVYDEVATDRRADGIDQVLDLWRGWADAFPDSKATFHTALVSGDTVVLEVTWNGTHNGALQTPAGPIPPSGRKISMRACQLIQIENGKVKSMRHYFDMATLLQQIGASQPAV